MTQMPLGEAETSRVAGLVAAAPNFLLAAALLAYWIAPTMPIFGGAVFSHRLLTAELFAMTYTVFAGIAGAFATWLPRGRELAIVGVQLAVAGWLAWLFSHEPAIAVFIGVVVLLRMVPQLFDFAHRRRIHPDEVARMIFIGVWALCAVVLASGCLRVMDRFGLAVPTLGLTPEVEAAQRAVLPLDALTSFALGPGRFADRVAGMVLYFLVVGIGAFVLHTRPLTGGSAAARQDGAV
jgi:hypothetical protein